jgi:tRNA threonylcarbamoyladenosine biosynthesis protein TsaE
MKIHGLEEMEQFGRRLGEFATPEDIYFLTGDLGAGKTTLTKGIALGLGINDMVKSPTYTIIREYKSGRMPLYHMDVYRVGEAADDLGLEEYFEGDGLSVVEWGHSLGEFEPEEYLDIQIEKLDNENEREIKLVAHGKKYDNLKEKLSVGD